jgi:hypothetical protein
MWMHNHSTMATILILGESEPPTRDGLSVTYISKGETLKVRRGEMKTARKVRVLESMLTQMWRGYRRQVGMTFPELNPRFMFIYEGRVFRIRPN